MPAWLKRVMAKLGFTPTADLVAHFGPHQRPGLDTPISCQTVQKLIRGQDADLSFHFWRESVAAAAGRKLPMIYQILEEVYEGHDAALGEIQKARMALPTIYGEAGDVVTVQVMNNVDVCFDTATSDGGVLSHMPDRVFVVRRDTGASVEFLLGGGGQFDRVAPGAIRKLYNLLLPDDVESRRN